MLRRFIDANVALCDRIEARLPARFTRSLHALHRTATRALMDDRPGAVVLDVGGGHLCPFAEGRDPAASRVVALDISLDQLRRNGEVDWKVAADACRTLPFKDGSVDVVVTRSVLEHLPDNDAFMAEAARITRPGGVGVHVFPARYAPFAVINRLLPDRLARALLLAIFPHWKSECGFPAHYHRCTADEMAALLARHGFAVEDAQLRYYQSIYFKFFLPLYLLSLGWDLAVWGLGLRVLACQVLVVARRLGGDPAQGREHGQRQVEQLEIGHAERGA